ncbi:MAG: VCBS repeat-containing protein [Acidobacteriota bacterium]
MKVLSSLTIALLLSISFWIIHSPSIAQLVEQEEILAISYTESSSGLSYPEWEEGRTELEMEDLDGDGKVDIVSIGDHGNPLINSEEQGIMVWFGDGRGSWSNYMMGDLGYGGIALGDVNNDGKMDVGYGMHHDYSGNDLGDQIFEVALGDGTGRNWTPWDDGLATNGETWGMFNTDFADIDNDGDLDVGSVSFGCCNGVHVYINRQNGTWVQSFGPGGGNSSMQFYFGDVNGDGNADIATSEEYGTVYLGNGYGGFALADGNLPPLPASEVRGGAHIGDVNNDGCQDLSYVNSQGGIEVWRWNGANTWVDASGTLPDTGTYDATQLYDMNVDGNMDLAAFATGKVTVWGGNGSGGWSLLTEFTIPRSGTHSAFRAGADADHNGFPDIALVDKEPISLFNYQNYLRFYKEASSPSSLSIKSISPRGKERFIKDSVRFIDWVSSVPSGQSFGTVKLELSTDGSSGPWTIIADNLPNNGRYQWTVASDKYSTNSFIRYTVTNSNGTSSSVTPVAFGIVPEELIRVTFPNKETIQWEDYSPTCGGGNSNYNLYRSDWNHFLQSGEYTQDPGVVPNAARFCDIPGPSLTDSFVPPPAELVFYLVSGNRGGTEGSLGRDSSGAERPNAHPCP